MTDRTWYDRALTILAFRARSETELRRKLREKGASPHEIDTVVQRLHEQKVLDDADYARQFTRNRLASAGASKRRIAQELGRKGIPRELADSALQDVVEIEGLDVTGSARRAALKKWRTLSSLDDVTRRRRLYAFLARRGFDPDEIRAVMNDLGVEGDEAATEE